MVGIGTGGLFYLSGKQVFQKAGSFKPGICVLKGWVFKSGICVLIIIIIMYIYHALINALSAHMIHINLNMIFYTHAEHSHESCVCIVLEGWVL